MFDERSVSKDNQQKLMQYYNTELSKGVDIGYHPKPEMYNPALAHSLKYDIAQFSAFKETSFRKQLEAALTKDGKILPWSEFKKVAAGLNVDYNKKWLHAEYVHTVATANMAQKWEDFERDKDLYPNIQFHTVGDARVRDSHKIYDGLILPINHPFWKTHTPPLDWGCRCTLTQTDNDVSDYVPKQKEALGGNAAKTGKIFNENAYKDGLSNKDAAEAKENLSDFLQSDTGLADTANPKVKISKAADVNDLERNYQVADICARELDIDFVIRAHREVKKYTNPEYLIMKQFLGDRKSILSLNNMRGVIDAAKEQMMNKLVNPKQIPHYIVWDLDLIKQLDIEQIIETLRRKVTAERGRTIKGMIFQYKGKAIHLSREQIIERQFDALNSLK